MQTLTGPASLAKMQEWEKDSDMFDNAGDGRAGSNIEAPTPAVPRPVLLRGAANTFVVGRIKLECPVCEIKLFMSKQSLRVHLRKTHKCGKSTLQQFWTLSKLCLGSWSSSICRIGLSADLNRLFWNSLW